MPRGELDAAVAGLAENLARKLPETIRYTKTQLNWWRDLVWSQTVQHARDWLAVHSTADETVEAVDAFHEKRRPRFAELRRLQAGEGATCPVLRRDGLSATSFCAHAAIEFCRRVGDDAVRRALGRECDPHDPRREGAVAAMNDEQLVLVERQAEQRTALVRLNRPKQLNALNGAVMDALCAALEELDRDDERARHRGDRQRPGVRRGRRHRRDGRARRRSRCSSRTASANGIASGR